MNTQLLQRPARRRQTARRLAPPVRQAAITFRRATAADAEALHALIASHLQEGRLLPRELDELRAHATRFIVATRRRRIVGCAELAPLNARAAEIRSLVVTTSARDAGIGWTLVAELQVRGRKDGFETLCAFTHDAGYFVRLGYSIVPHAWVPEKIAADCQRCPVFRQCGQYAVQRSLIDAAPSRTVERREPIAIGA